MIKFWIEAARLRTLPLAIGNISMGNILAVYHNSFSWLIFLLTLLTAMSLQILSNFANDYGDSQHGADSTDREGPKRMVQIGALSATQMKRGMTIMVVLNLLFGISLIYFAFDGILVQAIFLVLGLLAIWAAINYTSGSNPYGYRGWGDLSVLIFFGLIAVGGSYYLQTAVLDYNILLPALSCGLFSMAVLNVNNIRDIQSDVAAGKQSIPVKIGRKRAVNYHIGLLSVGLLSAVLFTILNFKSIQQLLFLIVVPLFIINIKGVMYKTKAMELDPYLKQMAMATLLFVVTFGIGLLARF